MKTLPRAHWSSSHPPPRIRVILTMYLCVLSFAGVTGKIVRTEALPMSYSIRFGLPAAFLTLMFTSSLSGSGAKPAASTGLQAVVTPPGPALQASASSGTVAVPAVQTVHVPVDVLSNRHPITPYLSAAAYPKDAASIPHTATPVVRRVRNATS